MSDTSDSTARLGTVTFELTGGRLLREYSAALFGIERLYEGLLTLDRLIDSLGYQPDRAYGYWRYDRPPWGPDSWPDVAVLPSERLTLAAVEAASPGKISLLGDIKVLEQIRLWLNDRAERRKDSDYRNSKEERRLELENQQLETDLLRSRIAAMREAGIPEVEIADMMRRLVAQPIDIVERAQDAIGLGGLPPGPDDPASSEPATQ